MSSAEDHIGILYPYAPGAGVQPAVADPLAPGWRQRRRGFLAVEEGVAGRQWRFLELDPHPVDRRAEDVSP